MDAEVAAQINNLPGRVVYQNAQNYSMPQVAHDVLFKIVIIGDTGVGKTCILKRLIHQKFNEKQGVTIGVEFGNFGMIMREETHVKLQIWDTAGQESFRSITRNFYQGSDGVFLVFDVTNMVTFQSIKETWLEEIKQHTNPNILIYLVGNFADMEDREVHEDEALDFAR